MLLDVLKRALGLSVRRRVRVFISYDHDEDARFKYLLRAWNTHDEFEFDMLETSPSRQINSSTEHVIRSALTRKLKAAEVLVVIVGQHTHKSDWIRWEIERAQEADVNLAIVAVKLNAQYASPPALLGVGATWVNGFTQEKLLAALRTARPRA